MAENPNALIKRLGLGNNRSTSVSKLKELGSSSVRTVNELGEVLQSLNQLGEIDLAKRTGLNKKDLDKWRIYRDDVIKQVNTEDPGTIVGGKYYPGQGKQAEKIRAGNIGTLREEQKIAEPTLTRGLAGDVLGFGKGLIKGGLARSTAANLAQMGKDPNLAFKVPEFDAAQRAGAGVGFGFEQNILPTIATVPGLVGGGAAVGVADRALGRFLPNNPVVNLMRVGARVGGAMLGAQGTASAFDAFGNPLRGLPKEQRESIEGSAQMALGGPEQKLGQIAATASVFGAPARNPMGRISMFEGAGVFPTTRAVMRNANKAFANPAVQETIGDVGERTFSIWQTDNEITQQNKNVEKGFLEKFGRAGTRSELKKYGYTDNNERLLAMAPDILFGGMTKFGSAYAGQPIFDSFAPKPGAGMSGPKPTSPMSPTGQPAPMTSAGPNTMVRPWNLRVDVRDANSNLVPNRISYNPATRSATLEPTRIHIPPMIATGVSEKLRGIGAPDSDGLSITSVTPDGEFIVVRRRADGSQVVETLGFNELPESWKPRVNKAFMETPNAQNQVKDPTTLPPSGVYNPAIDANPVYARQYKTKLNVDGTNINVAITKVAGDKVTVQTPSGMIFTVPKSAFAAETKFEVSFPSRDPASIKDIKAGTGEAKFPIGAELDGVDFFIPETRRAEVAAEPSAWRERFYRASLGPDDKKRGTSPNPERIYEGFSAPITPGTVIDLGAWDGVRQFGVVLGFRKFDIDGREAYGFEVQSIQTPNARPFMVPGVSIRAVPRPEPGRPAIDPTAINPVTAATAATAATPAAPATTATTPVTPVDPAIVPAEGAVAPVEGVDAAVAPVEGAEGAVVPTEDDESAPFNATAEFSEFEFSRLTSDQQLEVLTDGRVANWMFKVVKPEQWNKLSEQRRINIIQQAVRDPLFTGEVVGDIVSAATDEQQYLPAEGEPVIYGDRQNTKPGSFTHTVDLMTSRALAALNPNINVGFGEFIKSGASNFIVNALYNTDVISGPDDTPTFTDGRWYRFLQEKVALKNDEAFDFIGGSESPIVVEETEGAPTPPPPPGAEVPTPAAVQEPVPAAATTAAPVPTPAAVETPIDASVDTPTPIEEPIDDIGEEAEPTDVVEPVVSETPQEPIDDEKDGEDASDAVLPPEQYQFPFGYEFKEPAKAGSVPPSMEQGRGPKERYRTLAPGTEESNSVTVDKFRRAVPSWASGIGGFKRFVGKFVLPIFKKDADGNVVSKGQWELSVKGVKDKVQLKEVFMQTWGQTDEQSTALAEWVDRFSLSWAREFARIHGIRTMDRLRAIRLDTDPKIDVDMLVKDYDQWRRSYREQMLPTSTEETAQILRALQTAFYTQRLGVLSSMTKEQSAMLGTTGATFSILANGDKAVTVAVALQGKENYNTQVHEINHALVRSLYGPMIHELASKVYKSYSQSFTKRNRAKIQRDIEEQIVTELTNEMFHSNKSGDYNFFASNGNVEGGFDATLNRLMQDIGNLMRSSGYEPGSANDLANQTGWRVNFDKANPDIYVKGTPVRFLKQGKEVYGVLAERIPVGGTKARITYKNSDGQEITELITLPFIQVVGATNVTQLSAGARDYMIRFLGHWYAYTSDVVNRLAPSVEVSDVGFVSVDVAEVERRTVGYRWWDSVEESKEEVAKYRNKDFSDDRIRHRMRDSFLGWADGGGYEQYRKSKLDGDDVEPIVVYTLGLPVKNVPESMTSSDLSQQELDDMGDYEDIASMNMPEDDGEDASSELDVELAGINESLKKDDKDIVDEEGKPTTWQILDQKLIDSVRNELRPQISSRRRDPISPLLRSAWVPAYVNKYIMPKIRMRRGFENATLRLQGRRDGYQSIDEWFDWSASGPDSEGINSTVYASVYETFNDIMSTIKYDATTRQFNVTEVDRRTGTVTNKLIRQSSLPDYIRIRVGRNVSKALYDLVAQATAGDPIRSESYIAQAERAVNTDQVFINAYPNRVEAQVMRRAAAMSLLNNYSYRPDSVPRIDFKDWLSNKDNVINMSPKLVTDLQNVLNNSSLSAGDKIGRITELIKGEPTSRNSMLLSVVGTNNARLQVFVGDDNIITVPSFSEDAANAAMVKMTEQYAKEAAFKQTAIVLSFEEVVSQEGRSWEETVGAKDINLDDTDYDRQTSEIIDRAKRLEVFQMSEIMKSGVNFSSVYKDVYKRRHDTNLDRLTLVRDGYREKVKQAEATGKKVTKRQLEILAKTEADVANAEKLYSDFVDTAVESVEFMFARVLPYGKGSDVVLDFHRLVQAVAYGQRGVITQLYEKYRNNQMLSPIFVDNSEINSGLGDKFKLLADVYQYVQTVNSGVQSGVKVTDTYVQFSKRLTPLQFIVLESMRLKRQSTGIKPTFSDGKVVDGVEKLSKGFNVAATTLKKTRDGIVTQLDNVENGTDGKAGLVQRAIEADQTSGLAVQTVVDLVDIFINDVQNGNVTKAVKRKNEDGTTVEEQTPIVPKTYFDGLTQNEKRLHALTELSAGGTDDPLYTELLSRFAELNRTFNVLESLEGDGVNKTVDMLISNSVIPPLNVWTRKVELRQGYAKVAKVTATVTDVVSIAKDSLVDVDGNVLRACDPSIEANRNLSKYVNLLKHMGVSSKSQTVFTNEQLRAIARIGNANNDTQAAIDYATLVRDRDDYILKPLKSWLENHNTSLSKMTIGELNSYMAESGMSSDDSFAVMSSMLKLLTQQRSLIMPFVVQNGRLPLVKELPTLAQALVDNKRGRTDKDGKQDLKATLKALEGQHKSLVENVASYGLTYMTNASSVSMIERTQTRTIDTSRQLYGLLVNGDPITMDQRNGELRVTLIDQTKILGSKDAIDLAINDVKTSDNVPEDVRQRIAKLMQDTERLSARRVVDVIFKMTPIGKSTTIPAPGSKTPKLSTTTERGKERLPVEFEFAEFVRKRAVDAIAQVFDDISAGDGLDVISKTGYGLNKRLFKKLLTSSEFANDPAYFEVIERAKRITEAVAKDMIMARYELIRALNDPTLQFNSYKLKYPNGLANQSIVQVVGPNGVPIMDIDYKNASFYRYDDNGEVGNASTISKQNQRFGMTNAQNEIRQMLLALAGINAPTKPSETATPDERANFTRAEDLFKSQVRRIDQAALSAKSLRVVPAEYWVGKDRIRPAKSTDTIEPMYMNSVEESAEHVDFLAGTRDPETIDTYVKPVVMKWIKPDGNGYQRVQLNDNGIPAWDGYGYTVMDAFGNRSHTYAQLRANGLSADKALEVYAMTEHPDFLKWKAGDLTEAIDLVDPGYILGDMSIDERRVKQARAIITAEKLKKYIDNYMQVPNPQNFEWIKHYYDELFGHSIKNEAELQKVVQNLVKDNVNLEALRVQTEQFIDLNMTNDVAHFVKPAQSYISAAKEVKTGKPFTTMAFAYANVGPLTYQAPGVQIHDLGSGMHKNSNHSSRARFIKFNNPLVVDLKNSGIDTSVLKREVARAMQRGNDGIVFTNYVDSMFNTAKKNVAMTLDDKNVRYLDEMHIGSTRKITVTAKAIEPMFMNPIEAPLSRDRAPELLEEGMVDMPMSDKDRFIAGGKEVAATAFDNYQAIVRMPLSLDWAFTTIQGGKALFGFLTGRKYDTMYAAMALVKSWQGLMPNSSITIFGKKIGYDKLGRRKYMEIYTNLRKDPYWEAIKKAGAPLHMFNLERRIESERDRIYRESNGTIPYDEISIDLMDYDERGNLTDFFEKNTIIGGMPLQGMAERQISLQHDLLLYYQMKHQMQTNPVLANYSPEEVGDHPDAKHAANFLALSLGDFQYSTDERKDAIWGRVGKIAFVAPRWMFANFLVNPIGNLLISNIPQVSEYMRKQMGENNRVFDLYDKDIYRRNPDFVKYQVASTVGVAGWMFMFQWIAEAVGQLMGNGRVNGNADRFGSYRIGDWKFGDNTGSLDSLNLLYTNWRAFIGADPSTDSRFGSNASPTEKWIFKIMNTLGYRASPVISKPIAAMLGKDVLNRPVWNPDDSLATVWRTQLAPGLKALGADVPDQLSLALFWSSTAPSFMQEYTKAYDTAMNETSNKETAQAVALQQLIASFLGSRIQYDPYVDPKNMKFEKRRSATERAWQYAPSAKDIIEKGDPSKFITGM